MKRLTLSLVFLAFATAAGAQPPNLASVPQPMAIVDATGAQLCITGSPCITQQVTGSTTAVTQATASSLNAQVQGKDAQGATNTGNAVVIGGTTNPGGIGGTVNAWVVNSAGQGFVVGNMTTGSSGVAANGFMTGGSDGANYRHFRTDTSGNAIHGVVTPGTPITADSGNQANATATATLAAAAGKTTYITGFACTATGATAVKVVTVTLAGVITGTNNYTFVYPAGVTTLATPLIVTFPTPVPASATNTAIVVTLASSGSGGTNATCNAQGFQL